MKQKYQLVKNEDQGRLIIKELSEADPGVFVATCEEKIDITVLEAALQEGADSFRSALRTQNMFLPNKFMDKLVEGAASVLQGGEPVEYLFNDLEMIEKTRTIEEDTFEEDDTEEMVDIDELLDDDDAEEDIISDDELDPLADGGDDDSTDIASLLGGGGEDLED